MPNAAANPIVHIELQTANLSRACAFYTHLLGWRTERIAVGRAAYLALELGNAIEGGVVEREMNGAVWLPYVEVSDVAEVTERAHTLGAAILLEPRECPAGWRSIVAVPAGAEIALWQPKA